MRDGGEPETIGESAGPSGIRLVVLRGPSGSGKTSTARALRLALGRGTAWVEQDYLRRVVLREHDTLDAANIDLIALNVRFALERGFTVVLEGILRADHYGAMLENLHQDYRLASAWYYFDLSFEETIRRHATRPQSTQFSADDMRDWYRGRDLLPFVYEAIFSEDSSLVDTVELIHSRIRRCPGIAED
jgi:predicted kinase